MVEDMKNMLQAAEEKRQASLADLSAKHQKVRRAWSNEWHAFCTSYYLPIIIFFSLFHFSPSFLIQNLESFQMQLSDALSDRNKATETISSLQVRDSLSKLSTVSKQHSHE